MPECRNNRLFIFFLFHTANIHGRIVMSESACVLVDPFRKARLFYWALLLQRSSVENFPSQETVPLEESPLMSPMHSRLSGSCTFRDHDLRPQIMRSSKQELKTLNQRDVYSI